MRNPPPPNTPVIVSRVPNLHAYSIFANSGWDGNWYVGYDTCWIQKLPGVPPGKYSKAFIGARLGRMKVDRASLKGGPPRAIAGQISIGISSKPAWTKEQSFTLTRTAEIPFEGDAEVPFEGAGQSQWFWVEIPMNLVNVKGDNYLALWSPSPALASVSSAPVVGAAWSGKATDTWLAKNIQGAPPEKPTESPGSALSYFQPALVLKLIPEGGSHPITVESLAWHEATEERMQPMVSAEITGTSVEQAWLEVSQESGQNWTKVGRSVWQAPYLLPVDRTLLPAGKIKLRVVAVNTWGQQASGGPITMEVSRPASK